MAEFEPPSDIERIVEDGGKGLIDIQDEFKQADEEVNKAQESGNQQAKDEAQKVKEEKSKKLIERFNSLELTDDESKKVLDFLNDLESEKNPSKESSMKSWADNFSKFSEKAKKAIKAPFKCIYEYGKSCYRYFDTPEGKVKASLMDDANSRLEKAYESGSVDEQKEALQNYNDLQNDFKSEIDKDTKADKDGQSKWGDRAWSIIKGLLFFGGIFGLLALLASQLNGCYQYTDTDSKKLKCKYDNKSDCQCGGTPYPQDCNDSKNSNYPYCKCEEVLNQYCSIEKDGKSIYYQYDDSHTPLSALGDILNIAIDIAKKFGEGVGDIWAFLKKYGMYVIIVIGVLIALYIIKTMIEAYNETRHIIHQVSSSDTKE
jgi:hypothetical protein